MNEFERQADEFLKTADLYRLGALPTETPNPLTADLSRLARIDLRAAYQMLQQVDQQAMEAFANYLPELQELEKEVQDTLNKGGRIFLCGCGATGRLSISLEYLWRREHGPQAGEVISFMAGGDVALVHALEGFEDYPDYGARQLEQLGFREGDLLISSTEGGETPFVIGATERAAHMSKRRPFFLFCNPREVLLAKVERSRRVLENPRIHSICLFVGPMALAGSTRMQASTVLMLAIGLALFRPKADWSKELNSWRDVALAIDLFSWAALTEKEADIYQNQGRTLYAADEFAITVMTDTTERAPTFSLVPFDNGKFPRDRHSLTYLYMPQCESVEKAWAGLLGHEPRPLNWPEVNSKTSMDYLRGFDFGKGALAFRRKLIPSAQHAIFQVQADAAQIQVRLEREEASLNRLVHPLWDHLMLKACLNIHSTLIMGRLGRYEGNLMTYVKPTNGKLIDRATRYVLTLAERHGYRLDYSEVVRELFRQMPTLRDDEPIVLKTLAAVEARSVSN